MFTHAARPLAFAATFGIDTGAQRTVQEPTIVRAGGNLDEPGVATRDLLEYAARTFAYCSAQGLLGAGVLRAKNRAALVGTAGVARVAAANDVASRVWTAGITHASNVARRAATLGLAKVIARAQGDAAFVGTAGPADISTAQNVTFRLRVAGSGAVVLRAQHETAFVRTAGIAGGPAT